MKILLLSILTDFSFFSFWFWPVLLKLSFAYGNHSQGLIQKVWGLSMRFCISSKFPTVSVLLVHTLSSKALGSNIFLCFDQLAPWSIHYCFQYKLMPRSHLLCFLPSSAESADPLSVMRLLSWPLLTSVALARTGRDNGSYEDWWVLRGGECIRKRSRV